MTNALHAIIEGTISAGRRILNLDLPEDLSIWHRYWAWFPVRLVDGKWSDGSDRLWRRKIGGRFEYKQDPESIDDILNRTW
jgi:hypothetical protein